MGRGDTPDRDWSVGWALRAANTDNRAEFRERAVRDTLDAGSLVGGNWPPDTRSDLVRCAGRLKRALALLATGQVREEGQRQYIIRIHDRVNQLIEFFQRREKRWGTSEVWTVAAPNGRQIRFPLNDPAAHMFKKVVDDYGGQYETALIGYLMQNLGPGDVFVDVGAHTGYISAFAATTGASVFAMEIQRNLIPLIEQLASINAFDHLRTLYLGASSRAGLSLMRRGWTTPAAQLEGMTSEELSKTPRSLLNDYVPIVTLDGAFLDDDLIPKIIKIDAEGHEIGILDGSRGLIERGQTVFIVEVHSSDHISSFDRNAGDLLAHFDTDRWDFGQLTDDGVVPLKSVNEMRPDERDSHPKVILAPRQV